MTELWVIEAPGKARALEGILQRLGLEAKVQATRGHLMSMPDRLTPLGIDQRLHEYARQPRDMALVTRLRDEAKAAERLIIATDADQEGDVIAWDVREMCVDIHPDPVRVRLRGMDDDSVREAIASASAVLQSDAVPGRTRAIVDRMIGAAFSANGVAVGRVGTSLLGLVARSPIPTRRLRLSAPAEDGGRPFLAECPVSAPLDVSTAERIAGLSFPALPISGSRPVRTKPGHTGHVLVRASEYLDISPGEASKAMQRTYEAGRMSYPRSGSAAMSEAACKKVRDIIKQAGFAFNSDLVAKKTDPKEVHDAPHPIGPVALHNDPRRMGHDEGVRTLVARDLVRTGQDHVAETAIAAKVERFLLDQGIPARIASHVAGLDWRRERGPRFPGQEGWADSSVIERRPDAVLLEAAIEAGLGRPSTWAAHVEGFMARGLVDGELQLTDKGRQWVEASPAALLDPRLSAAIEKACERMGGAVAAQPGREPHEVLAERILNALPEDIRGKVLQTVAETPPQPRTDFRALAEPGIDLDAVARAPANVPSYRPPETLS